MSNLEVLTVETIVTVTLRLSLDAVRDIAIAIGEAAEGCDDETVKPVYEALANEFNQIADSAK